MKILLLCLLLHDVIRVLLFRSTNHYNVRDDDITANINLFWRAIIVSSIWWLETTQGKEESSFLPFSDLFPFNMYNLYFLFVAVLLQMTGMALVWKDVTWATRLHLLCFEMYRDVCSFIDIGQPKWWWTIAINILWRSVSSKSISVFFYLS